MRNGLIIGALVVAVALFWFLKPQPEKAAETVATPTATTLAPNAVVPQARQKEIFSAPREKVAMSKKQAAEAKPECLAFWDRLQAVDLQKFFYGEPNDENKLPAIGACDAVPPELSTAHKHFQQFCGNIVELKQKAPSTADVALAQCQTMAFLYRAKISDWQTRDIPLKDIADVKVLADKLMAKFAENPGAAAEAAEALLAKEPNLEFAAKAASISRFMDAQATATGKPDDPKWKKAAEDLSKLEAIKGIDKASADEIRVLNAQRRDPDPKGFLNEAVRIAEKDPSSWVGPYYAAWAEHALGNKQEAVKWLDVCLKNLPGDSRCQGGKERLAKGEATPFQSHLTFDLNRMDK